MAMNAFKASYSFVEVRLSAVQQGIVDEPFADFGSLLSTRSVPLVQKKGRHEILLNSQCFLIMHASKFEAFCRAFQRKNASVGQRQIFLQDSSPKHFLE